VGVPVLRMAVGDHAQVATPEHRLRLVEGMDALLDELEEQYPVPEAAAQEPVVCLGGKWEVDLFAARMLAHALSLQHCPALARVEGAMSAEHLDGLDLDAVRVVCVVWLAPEPTAAARHLCRRLKRRWPHVHIVLALWGGVQSQPQDELSAQLGADALALSLEETLAQVAQLQGASVEGAYTPAPIPADDEARLRTLQASGVLDSPALQQLCQHTAQRAADIFDVPLAMVSLVDRERQVTLCAHGPLAAGGGQACSAGQGLPRGLSLCGHVVARQRSLVVLDIARDARFAGNPALREQGLRFYAGVPLRDAAGHALGTLCLMDTAPRAFDEREKRLLQAMANDLMAGWRDAQAAGGPALPAGQAAPSATVGQVVPQ
ncbi:MAG: GAF domain-containing protein, partial [Acidovorax sp.]|nr:GAF domain-containing protein [Acidovorax sp.]